jgi:hypothetical protein
MPVDPQNSATNHDRYHFFLLFIALSITIIPFWCVSFPPITDLPQHLSQIFLLNEVLAGNRQDLFITPWYYANTLVYLPMWAIWHFVDPINTARLTMSALAAAWVVATFTLARARKRPIANWLIGIPFTFNFLFSWGLLNFLCGWPIFCMFIIAADAPLPKKRYFLLVLIGLLLYYAHSLWFLAANVWLFIYLLDRDRKVRIKTWLTLVPAWVLALAWYPQLAANRNAVGAITESIWSRMPFDRFDAEYITDAALGAIQGPLELSFITALLVWISAIVVTKRKSLRDNIDKPLFVAALLFLLAFWCLPSSYMNTVFFNSRWLPFGLVLLLLSLPALGFSKIIQIGCGLTFLATFSFATTLATKNWDREEFVGFAKAIELIKPSDRVFGMDLFGNGVYLKGRPGLQAFAWAQALRGCEINFNFTEHFSGAVQYRKTLAPSRSHELNWSPARATTNDLREFNLALINAQQTTHDLMTKRYDLHPVAKYQPVDTGVSAWRLYHIGIR